MENRIDHLRNILRQQKTDAILISSSSNIFYLSGFNRFLVDHDGYLLVTMKRTFLITSPLYTEAVKKFTPDLRLLETTPDVWTAQHVKKIIDEDQIKILGFEEEDLRVSEFFDLQDKQISLQPVSLRSLRLEKDEKELIAIQKACNITDKVFSHILSFIKEGVSEIQLSDEMDHFAKECGAMIGFPSIVAFGMHAAVPHHMTSEEKLQRNSFILFDFGIRSDGYLSDMSRTVFFGTPSVEQKIMHEVTKKSQEEAISFLENQLKTSSSAKISGKETDNAARTVIKKANLPVYPHSLGHGVGLDVHEAPGLSHIGKDELSEGMVFTIEPGIYIPSLGGIRIEDVFTIKNGKLLQLTHSSKELIVI